MKRFFKGYYFKCSTGDETVAFIPALHHDGKTGRASLQIITNHNSYTIPFPDIRFGRRSFQVRIGNSLFSEKGISIHLDTKECSIHGKLKFSGLKKLKYSIMGPFEAIPLMQCKHSIISMDHCVTGKLVINGKEYCFKQGRGYIEGDRGCSFPKEYIWTQCHTENASVMLSAATIPFLGLHWKGIIGIVMIGNREYRIATYLGARIVLIGEDMIMIRQGKYTLSARLTEARPQSLQAPVNGKMLRTIHESAACKAWYQFTCNHTNLLEFESNNASFEYEFQRKAERK